MSSTTTTDARVEKLAQTYRYWSRIFCTAQLGPRTDRASDRMSAILTKADNLGITDKVVTRITELRGY